VGKSTLLGLMGGTLKPDQGNVQVFGQQPALLSRQSLYRLRMRMGMLFQQGALFSDLTVYDNVAFLLREHTLLDETMIHDMVAMKLEAVGLRGAAHLATSELSGGMARRVALARAIMLDPELMMYDEPFSGQDPITRGVLLKLIRELNDVLGMTSVVVSHEVAETWAIADYVCVLGRGYLIAADTPKALLASDNPELHQFLKGLPDGAVPFHYPAPSIAEELAS
jgi:phospholipid/cholesterol/gamma-HCH transport system ATP-binding protein